MTRAQFVLGLGFVALGTVLLLDRSGQLDAGAVLGEWWPVVVILIGVAHVAVRPRQIMVAVFVTGLGIALLLWSLAGIDTVAVLWPLVLVALGLVLLTRRPRTPGEPPVVTDDELVAVFDDRAVRAPAGTLVSRSITTIFGDVALDLSDVALERRTTLQIVTIFGDVELIVPDSWMVTTSGPQIFGDVRIAPPSVTGATDDGLHLDVVTIFGDLTVQRSSVDAAGGAGPAAGGRASS